MCSHHWSAVNLHSRDRRDRFIRSSTLESISTRFGVVDSREEPPNRHVFAELANDPNFEVLPLSDKTLAGANEIVLSPGVPREERAVAAAIARGAP